MKFDKDIYSNQIKLIIKLMYSQYTIDNYKQNTQQQNMYERLPVNHHGTISKPILSKGQN